MFTTSQQPKYVQYRLWIGYSVLLLFVPQFVPKNKIVLVKIPFLESPSSYEIRPREINWLQTLDFRGDKRMRFGGELRVDTLPTTGCVVRTPSAYCGMQNLRVVSAVFLLIYSFYFCLLLC